jgi:hypothetical protein
MSASRGAETFALNGGEVLWRGPMGGTARLIFGTPGPLMFELWEWEMNPGERYEAKAHSRGTKEILYPSRGRVGAAIRGEEIEVRCGHGLFLETDAPHAYFCAGLQSARFRMIVVEAPQTGA